MSTNHTANYNLSQWVKSDQVLMEDFNEDNRKIDAAIKAEAETRAAGDAALTELIGQRNCQIYSGTYVGDGKSGSANPNQLTFPRKPVFLVVSGKDYHFFYAMRGQTTACCWTADSMMRNTVSWSGNTVKWYHTTSGTTVEAKHQLNTSGERYRYFAILEIEE